MTPSENQKSQPLAVSPKRDGGVYLLVADDSEEFMAALKKAALLAVQNNAHVAVLLVVEEEGFLHWGMIERRIKKDLRADAERRIWEVASRVHEISGQFPALYIREGKPRLAIMEVLYTDPSIKMLVLGAGMAGANPLISYFTGKGLEALKVPLLVIPGQA
jgi:hypothetical protein